MTVAASIDAETRALLRESMLRFRADAYAFERRRSWLADGFSPGAQSFPGYSEAAWREYAVLGWLALPLPADLGGFDGDPRAVAELMEHVGASLALEPVFASAVLCGGLLGASEGAETRLADIASGQAIYALAHAESAEWMAPETVLSEYRDGAITGSKAMVLHGDVATHLLVTARAADTGRVVLACVEPAAGGVSISRYRLVDGRGAASCVFDGAAAALVDPDAGGRIERVLDGARLALCSEALGAIRALVDTTNNYLKMRKQFGRPIGANQALQHRMVELFMVREELQSVIEAAERAHHACAAAPGVERDAAFVRCVSAASATAASAGRLVAHEAVQLHGGMGMTLELPVSHYFKRLMVTARLLGDRDMHLRRFASAGAT